MPLTKKNWIITVDCETSGLKNPVYDIGYTIHDNKGNIALQRDALVREIFTDGREMRDAYFAMKLFSDYAPMLDAHDIRLISWADICEQMREDIKKHDVNILAAYNLGFDLRAIRLTSHFLNESPIFENPVKLLDLWQFACETILNTAGYKKLARAEGWVSAAGNIRTNAECAYRFITNDTDFIENHTAMYDALIETEIGAQCFATHRKIPYGVINAAPWRIVNKKTKK